MSVGGHFAPMDLRVGGPTPPGWYHEVHPPLVLDNFFRIPKKSSSSKWWHSERSGIEIWVTILDLLPLRKKWGRGGGREFLSIFIGVPGSLPMVWKWRASLRSSPSVSSGGNKRKKSHEQNITPCFIRRKKSAKQYKIVYFSSKLDADCCTISGQVTSNQSLVNVADLGCAWKCNQWQMMMTDMTTAVPTRKPDTHVCVSSFDHKSLTMTSWPWHSDLM